MRVAPLRKDRRAWRQNEKGEIPNSDLALSLGVAQAVYGITACTWFENWLSTPLLSTDVTT